MSFWDNNKDTFKSVGKATAKGIGRGTKAVSKAGYRTYKNHKGETVTEKTDGVVEDSGSVAMPPSTPVDRESLRSLPLPPKRNVGTYGVPKAGESSKYTAPQYQQQPPPQQQQQQQQYQQLPQAVVAQPAGSGYGVVEGVPPPVYQPVEAQAQAQVPLPPPPAGGARAVPPPPPPRSGEPVSSVPAPAPVSASPATSTSTGGASLAAAALNGYQKLNAQPGQAPQHQWTADEARVAGKFASVALNGYQQVQQATGQSQNSGQSPAAQGQQGNVAGLSAASQFANMWSSQQQAQPPQQVQPEQQVPPTQQQALPAQQQPQPVQPTQPQPVQPIQPQPVQPIQSLQPTLPAQPTQQPVPPTQPTSTTMETPTTSSSSMSAQSVTSPVEPSYTPKYQKAKIETGPLQDPATFAPPPVRRLPGQTPAPPSRSSTSSSVPVAPSGVAAVAPPPRPTMPSVTPVSTQFAPPPRPHRGEPQPVASTSTIAHPATPPPAYDGLPPPTVSRSTPPPPARATPPPPARSTPPPPARSTPPPPARSTPQPPLKKAPPPKPQKKVHQSPDTSASSPSLSERPIEPAQPEPIVKPAPTNSAPNFALEIAARKAKSQPVSQPLSPEPQPTFNTASPIQSKPAPPKPTKPSKPKPLGKESSQPPSRPQSPVHTASTQKPSKPPKPLPISSKLPIKPKPLNTVKSVSTPPPPPPNPRRVTPDISPSPTPPPPPPARNYHRPPATIPVETSPSVAAPPPPSPPTLDLELATLWYTSTNSSPLKLPQSLTGLNYSTSYQSSGMSSTRSITARLPDLSSLTVLIHWQNNAPGSSAYVTTDKYVPSPLIYNTPSKSDLIASHTQFGNHVAAWCEHNWDKQIGGGECWDLAQQALLKGCGKHAFVSTYYHHGFPILELEGRSVVNGPHDEIKRGDVLQFTSCRFEGDGVIQTVGAPNHTSVVLSNDGGVLTVAEQNVNGVRKVIRGSYTLRNLTSGHVTAYRPMPISWAGE
ncbi:hypothetical protein CAAN3_08S01090 [[Candida] anglica]